MPYLENSKPSHRKGGNRVGHVDLNTITRPDNPNEYDRQKVMRGFKAASVLPLSIYQAAGWNLNRIVSTIRSNHRKEPVRIVAVDFVQLVKGPPEMSRESKEQQLSAVANTLANLARELGFTLLMPSQVNKEGATKHAEAINEASDLHLQIKTEEGKGKGEGERELKAFGVLCKKDRHNGHDGELLPIYLHGARCKFSNQKPGE